MPRPDITKSDEDLDVDSGARPWWLYRAHQGQQSVHSHVPRQKPLYLLVLAMIYDWICASRSVYAQVCLLNFIAITFTWHKIQQLYDRNVLR